MNDVTLRNESLPMRLRQEERCCPQNVGDSERLLSAAVGSGLTLLGLSRRGLTGCALSLAGAALVYRGWSGYCSLYNRLGLNSAAPRHADAGVRARHGRKIAHTVHVHRDRHELYDYWRNLENLPQVFKHLKSVEMLDDRRSRWTAHVPGGRELQWDAEIITDRAGEIIAWQSLPDSEVDTAGSVRFQDPATGEGTDLRVTLKYDPPGGRIVAELAHLVGHGLDDLLEEDLRGFKQRMETGETTTNAMQPSAAAAF